MDLDGYYNMFKNKDDIMKLDENSLNEHIIKYLQKITYMSYQYKNKNRIQHFELIVQYHDNIYESINLVYEKFTNSKIDFAAALLCLFYSGKLTQNAFKIVCELMKALTKDQSQIPSDINQCLRWVVQDDMLTYETNWFCINCKNYYQEIEDKRKNSCAKCGKR